MKYQPVSFAAVLATSRVTSVLSQDSRPVVAFALGGKDFPEQAEEAKNKTAGEAAEGEASGAAGGCDGGGDCAGGEFCGSDGRCHLYNCGSWWEFGPAEDTGNANQKSEDASLNCEKIAVTTPYEDNGGPYYPSILFECKTSRPEPVVMGFTSHCTAQAGPNSNSKFDCYELDAATDFQPFLDAVNASQLNCRESGYPKYEYTVVTELIDKNDAIKSNERPGFELTDAFNGSLALNGTMVAMYDVGTTDQPTGSPTASPTPAPTASPTASPTGSPTAAPTAPPTAAPTPPPDAAESNARPRTGSSAFFAAIAVITGALFFNL